MALAVPRIRLRLPVPVAGRWDRSLAWRLRMGSGDMLNIFTANDLEAAGLLARARYGDGALTAGDGQRRHAMRLAWQRGEACRAE
jgi:hypothetical protein